MPMTRNIVLVAVGCLTIALGCVSAGLKRTPFDEWSVRKYDNVGIEVEIPKHAMYVDAVKKPGWKCLSFRFHCVGSGVFLDEPIYVVTLNFVKFNKSEYDEFKLGKQFPSHYWIYENDYSSLRTNIVRLTCNMPVGLKEYGWRCDYPCPDGGVVLAFVSQYFLKDDSVSFMRDTDAILRVLKSVKVVEH